MTTKLAKWFGLDTSEVGESEEIGSRRSRSRDLDWKALYRRKRKQLLASSNADPDGASV